MDYNRTPTLKRRSNINLASHRIKSKLVVFRDKYLNFYHFFRFFFPIFIVLVSLPFLIFYLIKTTYEAREINTLEDIPTELRTAVIVLNYDDLFNNASKVKPFFDEATKLYSSKKISNIYVFALSNSVIPSKKLVYGFFKDIPEDKIIVNIETQSLYSVCKKTQSEYNMTKFITLSYKNYLFRLNYDCNSLDNYSVGYSPSNLNIMTGEVGFVQTIQDVLKINFNI